MDEQASAALNGSQSVSEQEYNAQWQLVGRITKSLDKAGLGSPLESYVERGSLPGTALVWPVFDVPRGYERNRADYRAIQILRLAIALGNTGLYQIDPLYQQGETDATAPYKGVCLVVRERAGATIHE